MSPNHGLCVKIRHAAAATAGICPFPTAASLSTLCTTPSATLSRAGSSSHEAGTASPVPLLRAQPSSWSFLAKPPASLSAAWCSLPFGFGSTARSLAWATTHRRSLAWGAPTCRPESTPHRASNPIAARSPRTRSNPRTRRAGEFSTNTNRGRTSSTTRAISRQSPLRSPSSPLPFPAVLKSWQGNPPDTTSTIPFQGLPSNVRTSSQIGNGRRIPSFWRWHRTPMA